MSMQVVNRNNVVAGVFLIASILLAVAISFILSDIGDKFGSKKSYVFRFSTTVGVTGLKPGATVTFGGFDVGRVKSIEEHVEIDPESGLEIIIAHDVFVSLASDLVIYEDAFADLTLPMLGGVSMINIPSAGTGSYTGGPSDANTVLDEGEVLRGRFAPSILTQLGFSTEDAEKIRATIDNVKTVSVNANDATASFKRMSESLEPEFMSGVDDGRATMANIRAFTEGFNGEDGWSTRVDGILASTHDAAEKFSPTVDDAHNAINEARGVIEENRPRVARILDNVEQTTERVRFDSMGRIDELLEKGTLALSSYKDLGDKANTMLDVNRPKVDSTLSSARDIGVNSKLFVEELRAQPWRLLKKPSKEDLEREPIYEAARAYAEAVADLRAASEALDSAVGSAGRGDAQANTVELVRISKVVEEAYGRYEEAERGLLERLRQPSPSTTP
jgi:ABC-type transporter Mla subunit MlaD